MRRATRILIYLLKPHRLVPELDGLDDQQCRVFLAYVDTQCRREGRIIEPFAFAMLVFVPMSFGLLIADRWGIFAFSDAGSITGRGWLALLLSLVAGLLLWMRMRRVASPRHVGMVARALLRRPRCAHCAVLLTDLTPDDRGLVVCPFCKRPCIDPAHFRSIEQLAACDAWRAPRKLLAGPQPAGDRNCVCGYPFRGLPVEGTTATCPECGRQAPVRPEPE